MKPSRYPNRANANAAAQEALKYLPHGAVGIHEQEDGSTVKVEQSPLMLRSSRPGRWTATFSYRPVGNRTTTIEVDIMDGTAELAIMELRRELADRARQLEKALEI